MSKKKRKGIDIDEDTLRGLKILAVANDTSPKAYIEKLLTDHVKANGLKILREPAVVVIPEKGL